MVMYDNKFKSRREVFINDLLNHLSLTQETTFVSGIVLGNATILVTIHF